LVGPNCIAVGAPPQTPLGELSALPTPGGEGARCPVPKNPSPLSAFGISPRKTWVLCAINCCKEFRFAAKVEKLV